MFVHWWGRPCRVVLIHHIIVIYCFKIFIMLFSDVTIVVIIFCKYVRIIYIEYLIQNGHMSEDEAKKKFCQIVKAVDYCHRHNIVHRDLKVFAKYSTLLWLFMFLVTCKHRVHTPVMYS